MSDDPESGGYAPDNTLLGRLQRGHGRGAIDAAATDNATEPVSACVRTDWRWDWQIDQRPSYLARLARDLDLPTTPIIDQLRHSHRDDDENAFVNALQILELLALGGDTTARHALIRYVHHGPHWLDAAESLALAWPQRQWQPLYSAVGSRLTPSDIDQLFPDCEPWATWGRRDSRLAANFAERRRHLAETRTRSIRHANPSTLLSVLHDPDQTAAAKSAALFTMAIHPPEPALLELAPSLTRRRHPDRKPAPLPGLYKALKAFGPAAVPHARLWAQGDEPLAWLGTRILAAHGDSSDLDTLVAQFDRLRDQGQWCGFDVLVKGMLRLALPHDTDRIGRFTQDLRFLWTATPHSYERATYLDALIAMKAEGLDELLYEGLFDCEDQVRELAVAATPLTRRARTALHRLSVDRLETRPIRRAAALRLDGPDTKPPLHTLRTG